MMHKLILPVLVGVLMAPAASAFAAAPAMPSRDLMVGAKGGDVVFLQQFLIDEDAGPAARALKVAGATGNFGQMTRAAVIEFQKARGIGPAMGFVGPKTRALLTKNAGNVPAPTFTGKIEAVDTGCFADGVCSVTVDGKKVILLAGFRISPPPVGSLKGVASIGDLEGKIGSTARVYAATSTQEGYDYTLYGSPTYYVEVVASPAKIPSNGPITLRGTIGCLQPKDPSQPTIAMCVFGLKANDGNAYALSSRNDRVDLSAFGEKTVEVRGTFRAGENLPWNSVGTVTVRSIREVK